MTINKTRSSTQLNIDGNLDIGTHKVINVVDPTLDQDAATKKYIDTKTITITGDATGSGTPAGISLAVNKTRLNVRNETGVTIASTKAVYVSGFNNLPLIALATNITEVSHNVVGITVAPIAHQTDGFIAVSGQCDAETNGWTVGTELYLSTAGALTATPPTSGSVRHVAIVTVQANYPIGKLLIYQYPEENYLAGGAGVNTIIRMGDSAGANKVSFRDYANAEVGSINSDGTIAMANLSGTNTGDNAGVTSVTGTSPIVSTGGNTPAISIPAATAAVNGYMTASAFSRLANTNGTNTGDVTLAATNHGLALTNQVISLGIPSTLTATTTNAVTASSHTHDITGFATGTGTASGTNTGDQTLAGLGGVPTTRTLSTTAPITGGGDLSANRTLAISAATTGAAGSMSATDKTKLDAMDVAVVELSTWTPLIQASGGGGSYPVNTYSTGNYIKTGNLVYLEAKLTLGTVVAGGTGYIQIRDTPYAKIANSSPVGYVAVNMIPLVGTYAVLSFITGAASRILTISEVTSNGAMTSMPITALSTGDVITLSITYICS